MTIHYEAPHVRIYLGDACQVMSGLAPGCVNCVVTSPPYLGLRDYGVEGQLGAAGTPVEGYVQSLVDVFAEVHRVLADDGTLWLNLGDSYVDKNLAGAPWRVALALQEAGWYLRADVIWHKPAPRTESVKDRPTRAHEYLFLLTKRPRYYFDQEAVREPTVSLDPSHSSYRPNSVEIAKNGRKEWSAKHSMSARSYNPAGRNVRSVWTITTKPYKGAHFATFPPELVERCILAGCPEGGVVLDPFLGSGTTAAVSLALGRQAVGIELNPEYADLAQARIEHATKEND